MTTQKIQEERVQNLNDADLGEGDYVLYWMQSSQRAEQNHALEYAVQRANDLEQRLLVLFGLTEDYPEANLRHYAFMLEGLKDAQEALRKRGILMVVRKGSPDEVALDVGEGASLIVTDRGYMRPQKRWRERVAKRVGCLLTQVESDVVCPSSLRPANRSTPRGPCGPRSTVTSTTSSSSSPRQSRTNSRPTCRRMGWTSRTSRRFSTVWTWTRALVP